MSAGPGDTHGERPAPEPPAPVAPLHVVVMGVSGSGKSTVARLLASRLGWAFAEADEFHPPANVAKMRGGTPLTDEDRWPWLRALRDWLSTQARGGHSTVVTCSALRRRYRDLLRGAPGELRFVHLTGTREQLAERMGHRQGHFMPLSLLDSQLGTLEPPSEDERALTLDIRDAPSALVEQVLAWLDAAGDAPERDRSAPS